MMECMDGRVMEYMMAVLDVLVGSESGILKG